MTTSSSPTWPALLPGPTAIAEYVSELSPYEICFEAIEEQYINCQARLVTVELASLDLGPEDNHLVSKERQAACDRKPIETMPPLLVDEGMLMDGYHRLRSLLARGATHHLAYVVEEIPEPELEARPVVARKSRWDEAFEPT